MTTAKQEVKMNLYYAIFWNGSEWIYSPEFRAVDLSAAKYFARQNYPSKNDLSTRVSISLESEAL